MDRKVRRGLVRRGEDADCLGNRGEKAADAGLRSCFVPGHLKRALAVEVFAALHCAGKLCLSRLATGGNAIERIIRDERLGRGEPMGEWRRARATARTAGSADMRVLERDI